MDSDMTLSYIEHLERMLAEHPPKQKGLRTRERLKIATAKVLEQRGYHAMRVTDVTDCAQVAEGSFYVYFNDKTDAALSVLTGMLEDFFDPHMARSGARAPHDAIRQANRKWISLSRANSGLIRCVFQLGDQLPEFARLTQRSNRQWYDRMAQSFARRHAGMQVNPALLVAYLLGSMMDEIVRKLIVYPDMEFHALLDELGADDVAVADAATLLWLRILLPDAPPLEDLPPAALALSGWLNQPDA